MANHRETLRARFAAVHVEQTRRADFKGYRARMNLRVPESLSHQLQIIKVVTGEAKNSFCERVIAEAVQQRIIELRAHYGTEVWSAFENSARKGKKSLVIP